MTDTERARLTIDYDAAIVRLRERVCDEAMRWVRAPVGGYDTDDFDAALDALLALNAEHALEPCGHGDGICGDCLRQRRGGVVK